MCKHSQYRDMAVDPRDARPFFSGVARLYEGGESGGLPTYDV